jgi:hypothetical protein
VLAPVFWDKDGVLLVDYLEKGTTIMTKYHLHFPTNWPPSFRTKSCFFKTVLLTKRHYTPEVGRSSLWKHFKGRKFCSIEEATLAADEWLAAHPKEFFV